MAVPTNSGTQYETNHKIWLENGAYNATIVDEWVRFVTEVPDGTYPNGNPKTFYKYSKEPTDHQRIKITVTLDDDPSIVLGKDMSFYASKGAAYAKAVGSITGMVPGSPEMKAWDSKNLRGMKVTVEIANNGNEDAPFSNIKEIRARPKSLARPAVRPVDDRAFTPADAAKLGIEPMNEAEFDESQIPF